MFHSFIKAYNDAVFDTDRESALQVIDKARAHGHSPEEIIFQLVIPAVEEMMDTLSEDPDANLAQHFMTAQIAAEVSEKMLAQFSRPPATVGRVVIGTARGDLHSLGKRIVTGCLKTMMVEVLDLGVNVPAEQFVTQAIAFDAQVIAISAMMVHTANGPEGCRKVRQLLRDQQLEHRFRLVVGGAPYRFDEQLFQQVGADAWAADGVSAGKVILNCIRELQP
ncbi:MAG: cobalamin-dependent protein [Magnetococcales bacterium]|nr:cobalamin-dependent protein [Magnetococcales bacterium]